MNTKFILSLLLLLTTYCSATYLYSVARPEYKNGQLVTIIDISTGDQISNFYFDTDIQVVEILSIDQTSNTLLLLCSNAQDMSLVSVDIGSSNFTFLGTVNTNLGFEYEQQRFTWIAEQQIAFLPALVGVFSLTAPISSLEFNFNSNTATVTNYTLEGISNIGELPVQGFDPLNLKVYLSYSTFNNGQFGTNILSYDYSSLVGTQQTYVSINNVTNVNLIFTDSSSNVYLIKPASYFNGLIDICKLDLTTKTCPTIHTHSIGSYSQYQFIPYLVSQDGSTLLIISADQESSSSSSSSSSGTYTLTFFNINSNFEQTTLTIDNYWPLDQFYSNTLLF